MAAISKTPTGNYKGVYTSQPIDSVVDAVNNLTGNGTPQAATATSLTATGPVTIGGTLTVTPQQLTAAGQTQGTATAITSSKAVVTAYVTATHNGVKLPTASTGLEVIVINAATPGGIKVYPATGGKIGAASTNVADTNLGALKANRYIAVNKTLWAVQYSA